MKYKFLIHGKNDSVGVAVQDIAAGEKVIGVFLDSNDEVEIKANNNICLGHKIAVESVKKGDVVHEYDEIIGKATEDFNAGDHVHVHNIKSARW